MTSVSKSSKIRPPWLYPQWHIIADCPPLEFQSRHHCDFRTELMAVSAILVFEFKTNKKFCLDSQLQTYQILTNNDQMVILCLSCFITTVQSVVTGPSEVGRGRLREAMASAQIFCLWIEAGTVAERYNLLLLAPLDFRTFGRLWYLLLNSVIWQIFVYNIVERFLTSLYIRCGHVVRDFESEAKTR